jgi:pentatricopeptide repeat protein
MYGKCGCLWYSENVFNNIRKEDVISWNAMIGAYAQHGESLKALQLVEQMQEKGVTPDTITIISFLNAMSHTGLLYEAYRCISLMVHSFGIAPSVDHYICIMDSIRRTGKMEEVECFIRCMPFQPKTISYMSFLGACRSSINVEHGKFAAKHMSELDPENAGPYVSLSNIYASIVEE